MFLISQILNQAKTIKELRNDQELFLISQILNQAKTINLF